MKRGSQFTQTARETGVAKPRRIAARSDADVESEQAVGADGAAKLREAVRETEPLGAFDARAIADLYKGAPADPKGLRRTIRRAELRQIVPLADSTIYELERRGEFPQRFFLTARCVVWDLGEIEAWIEARRRASAVGNRLSAAWPDVRLRRTKPGHPKP